MTPFLTWLNSTETTAFGMQQGALVALVFLLGLLLIWLIPKYKWLAAAALLVFITPLTLAGYWFSLGELGISDWDYYFSLHTGHRNTLLNYGQLPHWNPYICGGTAGIADPEFRFFTPTFLLQLAFGIPVGFRLAIFLTTATGAIGMLLLGKRLGLSVYAALLAAIGVAFSSVNLLEITEGHPNIFAAMYIPWVFWAWLAAYRQKRNQTQTKITKEPNNKRFGIFGQFVQFGKFKMPVSHIWPLITGIFLALTFFQGGIYLLMYTIIAFFGLLFLVERPKAALVTTLTAGLWALGLAAIKLIPVLLWLSQFQDEHYASSTYILPDLDKVLLGRILHGPRDIIPDQLSGWHEYGAYVGPIILILAAVGFIRYRKRRVVQALLVAAAAATYLASAGPVLKPIFDVVPVIPRSNISRFMLFAVIPLALLAGFGLDAIRQKLEMSDWKLRIGKSRLFSKRLLALIPVAIIALTAADLMSLVYPISEQAFVLPRHLPPPPPAPSPIAYTAFEYKIRYRVTGADHTRAYEATLAGYGTLSYCSVLTPPKAVRTIHDEAGNDIIEVETNTEQRGSFKLLSWTPNIVKVQVDTPVRSTVFLNANYAKGWHINGEPAAEKGNRVGIVVPAGVHTLTFEYYTRGFTAGTIVSLITLGLAAWAIRQHWLLRKPIP